jgi:hypothetical protein
MRCKAPPPNRTVAAAATQSLLTGRLRTLDHAWGQTGVLRTAADAIVLSVRWPSWRNSERPRRVSVYGFPSVDADSGFLPPRCSPPKVAIRPGDLFHDRLAHALKASLLISE